MDIHAHRLLRYPPTPLCIIPSSLCLASHARSRFPSCTFCSPHISARSTIPRTIIHCAWHLRNDYHELPLGLATRLFAFAFFRSTTTRTRTRTEPHQPNHHYIDTLLILITHLHHYPSISSAHITHQLMNCRIRLSIIAAPKVP